MTECPHCHRDIEINEMNYGTLFNCPLCNAVYFVGWDGKPELPPTAEEMQAESEMLNEQENVAQSVLEVSAETMAAEVAIENELPFAIPNNELQIENEFVQLEQNSEFASEGVQDPSYDSLSNLEQQQINSQQPLEDQSTPYDFDRPLGEVAENKSDENQADSSDFSDVTDFANSDTMSGPISYHLQISGIDSGNIYGQIKEAITDSRFGWDAPEIMKSIQSGVLNLNGLNAAKAFVLVNRIKYLPVQINWRQDVLSSHN